MARLLAIIILIVAGYLIFRYLVRMFTQEVRRSEGSGNDYARRERALTEEEYRRVLGVSAGDSPSEIRKRYKDLLSKYHPDKVQHLGVEFQEMAEKKTKAIMEAYEFFRKKYNL